MEADWKSIVKEGNPLTEGEYLVTIVTESGRYDTQIGMWQREYWNFDKSVVVAYVPKPKPYPWSLFKGDMEGINSIQN